jgi:hypothetical protein
VFLFLCNKKEEDLPEPKERNLRPNGTYPAHLIFIGSINRTIVGKENNL